MYPQTHVYFAERVLGKTSDEITLGSIFPDLIISNTLDHTTAHHSGQKIFNLLKNHPNLIEFAKAVITHGIEPHGLDYYGDEKYFDFERGYCFEKGKAIIDETIAACNIPTRMGWWKSHNIIEMGIELLVNDIKPCGSLIRQAFNNRKLIGTLDKHLMHFHCTGPINLVQKTAFFADYIEIDNITEETLAAKYEFQMITKHNILINRKQVACLIEKAAKSVTEDLDEFFDYTAEKVKENLFAVTDRY
ncbi:hypothetical protein [Desulfolucanica intricata]|uniref:hypothetical protein n=1 Tax=Desulfolucanica intricata TaxID=1285191 RepID=UPI00082FB24D|nr:hypothetical protein [Desulfolucanica intricata]